MFVDLVTRDVHFFVDFKVFEEPSNEDEDTLVFRKSKHE
jgi:hypothetical protein